MLLHPGWALVPESGVGSRIERTDPICFLAGCHERQLNLALSVVYLTVGFLGLSLFLY